MGQNVQESGRKYWATRSSVRSFAHVLIHSRTHKKSIIRCLKAPWFCPTVRGFILSLSSRILIQKASRSISVINPPAAQQNTVEGSSPLIRDPRFLCIKKNSEEEVLFSLDFTRPAHGPATHFHDPAYHIPSRYNRGLRKSDCLFGVCVVVT